MRAEDDMTFSGGQLDRQAHRRGQSEALLGNRAARVLPMWRGRPLVIGGAEGGAPTRLAMLPADAAFLAEISGTQVFLGSTGGGPLFAMDVSGWAPDSPVALDAGPGRVAEDQPAPALGVRIGDARFADLRGLLARLEPVDGEIVAAAKGILEWHRSHGFCARCGAASQPAEGGWRRDCPACGTPHFPRTDPVVIMLVTDGNRLLLGRSPGWPEEFYSLLAGFMEPGETVSAAVRREVMEEVGIAVGPVRLLTSQPWPFPTSVMIGCIGAAESREITLDPAEMEDALWLSREEVLSIFAGTHSRIATPRAGTIAQFLIKMWLADRLD